MLRRNVLIFHSAALGDFVLTWPLAVVLGRLHPQSRIIYITQGSKGAMASRVLRLDWMDAETGWPALYIEGVGLPETCQRALDQAHTVYTFSADAERLTARGGRTGGAKVLALRSIPPGDFAGHSSEYLLSELSAVPAVRSAMQQILASIAVKGLGTCWSAVKEGGPTRPILVHPGSGSPEKCWPLDRFIELIDRLTRAGRPVRVALGEVELDRWTDADLRRLASSAPVVRPATYVDLLGELSNSAAFIGNDSGPAHLAGIIGVPTFCLFGPTNPATWRPLGPRVKVLQHTPDIEPIFTTLQADLG